MTTAALSPRTATTSVELHPLLADRWSPRAFDRAPLEDADVTALLEAARWAPSANNYQPWRFLVGRTSAAGADATYTGLLGSLAEFNLLWASAAPVLIAAAVEVEHEDGSPREIAPYELGLAVSQLTVEAAARGLQVHQMGGFDADRLAETFGVPPQYRAVVVLAVGRVGDADTLPGWAAERETAPRDRKPLSEIAFTGTWGNAA
jgi:nitroreductase